MLAQFDLCRLPYGALVVVLQDGMHAALGSRIVAPVVPLAAAKSQPKGLSPVFDIGEQPHAILIQSMGAVPRGMLRHNAGDVRFLRDEIIRAIDLLFTGV